MKLECRILNRSNIMSGISQAGNPWQKQTIICETLATYPKKVALTVFNSTVDTMNQIPDGSVVEVMISVESREYNGKWYTDIFVQNAVLKAQAQPQAQPVQQPIQYQQPVQQPAQQVSQAQVQQLLNQRLPQPTSIQFHQSNQQPVQPQQQVTYTDDLPF